MSRLPRPLRTIAGTFSWSSVVAVLAVAVLATSATVGTGIEPLDAGVDAVIAFVVTFLAQVSAPTAGGADGRPPATPSGPDVQHGVNRTAVERHVHRYVDAERAERGLEPLEWDPALREIARYHSRDMATTGYVGHTAPDGETVEDRYRQFGYDCRAPTGPFTYATSGENVARTWYGVRVDTADGVARYDSGAELARGIVDGWLDSPSHRENLLADHWRREGVGIYVALEDGQRAVYATQNFC